MNNTTLADFDPERLPTQEVVIGPEKWLEIKAALADRDRLADAALAGHDPAPADAAGLGRLAAKLRAMHDDLGSLIGVYVANNAELTDLRDKMATLTAAADALARRGRAAGEQPRYDALVAECDRMQCDLDSVIQRAKAVIGSDYNNAGVVIAAFDWLEKRREECDRLREERTAALAAVDGVDLREGHIRDNATPDQLRDMLYGAGMSIADLRERLRLLTEAARPFANDTNLDDSWPAGWAVGPFCWRVPYPNVGQLRALAALVPAPEAGRG